MSTTLFCEPVAHDPRCPDCGGNGRYHDSVIRSLTDLPLAGYPLVLRVECRGSAAQRSACGRPVLYQDLGKLAAREHRRRGAVPSMCWAVDDRPRHHFADRRRAGCVLAYPIAMRATASLISATGPAPHDCSTWSKAVSGRAGVVVGCPTHRLRTGPGGNCGRRFAGARPPPFPKWQQCPWKLSI